MYPDWNYYQISRIHTEPFILEKLDFLAWILPETITTFSRSKYFQKCKNHNQQSGPKVLDHWGVITNDFPRSPFSILIHIVPARTPLLSATLKQGVGRGNCIWIQGLGVTIPLENRQEINVSAVNGWMKLKRKRRSNDFWPWLSERVSKYCI